MAFRERKNGCWCFSDINIVAALTTESGIIKGKEVDTRALLPPVEWSFSYVKLVPVRRPKKIPKGDPRRGRFDHGVPNPKRDDVMYKPVIMFALAPFRGSFALHEQKLALWHSGHIMMTKDYPLRHRELLNDVHELLDEYRKQLRSKRAEVEKKHGEYTIAEELRPSKAEEVARVSVPHEDHP